MLGYCSFAQTAQVLVRTDLALMQTAARASALPDHVSMSSASYSSAKKVPCFLRRSLLDSANFWFKGVNLAKISSGSYFPTQPCCCSTHHPLKRPFSHATARTLSIVSPWRVRFWFVPFWLPFSFLLFIDHSASLHPPQFSFSEFHAQLTRPTTSKHAFSPSTSCHLRDRAPWGPLAPTIAICSLLRLARRP